MKKIIRGQRFHIVGELCMTAFLVLMICSSAFAAAPWDGTVGTLPEPVDNVYTITTPQELAAVVKAVNNGTNTFKGQTIRLGGDIDLNEQFWSPIGTPSKPFSGNFDGNNHSVKGLRIITSTIENGIYYAGFFGYISSDTLLEISDVTVSGSITISSKSITGNNAAYISGIAAFAYNTNFSGCTSDVNISVNYDESAVNHLIGGIAGILSNGGTVQKCKNIGTITSRGSKAVSLGGLVGASSGTVDDSVNEGKLTIAGAGAYAGGIVATLYKDGAVHRSKNIADIDFCVSNGAAVGGVVGSVLGESEIIGCENSGTIKDTAEFNNGSGSYAGGIVGRNDTSNGWAVINACINTGNISVQVDSVDVGGIAGASVGDIANSKNSGDLSCSSDAMVGGIVGSLGNRYSERISVLSNCVNEGNIKNSGSMAVGGIAHEIINSDVYNCTAMCDITSISSSIIGGIVGSVSSSEIDQSAYIGVIADVNAQNVGGIVGAVLERSSVSNSVWQVINASEIGAIGGTNANVTITSSEYCASLADAPITSVFLEGYNGIITENDSLYINARPYPLKAEHISNYIWSVSDSKVISKRSNAQTAEFEAVEKGISYFTLRVVSNNNKSVEFDYPLVIKQSNSSSSQPPTTTLPQTEQQLSSGGGGGGCNTGLGSLVLLVLAGVGMIAGKAKRLKK